MTHDEPLPTWLYRSEAFAEDLQGDDVGELPAQGLGASAGARSASMAALMAVPAWVALGVLSLPT